MTDTIKRIPRPLGATQLARNYQIEESIKNKQRLLNLILKAFISNTLYHTQTIRPNLYHKPTKSKLTQKEINQSKKPNQKDRGIYTNAPNDNAVVYQELVPMSFQALASFLSLTEDKCRKKMLRLLQKNAEVTMTEEMEREGVQAMARAQIKEAFFGHLQQGLIHSEWGTELRTVARLNGYHPLQVKEANSAMAQHGTINKQVWDMAIKMAGMSGTQQATQVVVNQNNQPTTNNQYLTPTMAVQLIEEKGYNQIPASGTVLLEQLAMEHNISQMPDVKAIGADAQGIVAPKVKDLAYIQHEDRREAELGIVDHQVE